ncbi:transmembrane protein, putative [Medicago truncatula]|uniref:Transmembrane protein, putative n=1 Tax=Medicago truncatula TaxID=3880 RepID=A0A072TSH6_MEDTR|nr:transmembrane protein, putative [Medicago truncatula]
MAFIPTNQKLFPFQLIIITTSFLLLAPIILVNSDKIVSFNFPKFTELGFPTQQAVEDKGKADAGTLDANLVELNPKFTKEDLKEQNKEKKDPLNEKLLRPIPDGEFELVPFGDDPSKNFKISKGLPELVKAQLVACLKENAGDEFEVNLTRRGG